MLTSRTLAILAISITALSGFITIQYFHLPSPAFNVSFAQSCERPPGYVLVILDDNGFNDTDDSYLAEWDLRATPASTTYGRVEHSVKQILGLGFHPRGLNHKHTYETIDAITLGYLRERPVKGGGRVGLGGDVTVYGMSPSMIDLYEGSRSFHLFLRWRPAASSAHIH